ncbi:MAG: hypothetical protein QM499_01145 [Flavobacteriaceae bacterium]
MEKKEANKKVNKLFNKWLKEFRDYSEEPTKEYYNNLDNFTKECKKLHNTGGLYTSLTDKSALKMASICSSVRFVEPYRMLMKLQHTTKTY